MARNKRGELELAMGERGATGWMEGRVELGREKGAGVCGRKNRMVK